MSSFSPVRHYKNWKNWKATTDIEAQAEQLRVQEMRVNWKTGKQKRKWAGQTLSLSVWSKSEDADDDDDVEVDDDEVVAVAGDWR